MIKMFRVKDITHNLRNSNILCQPKFIKISYGKIPFAIMINTSWIHYLTMSLQYFVTMANDIQYNAVECGCLCYLVKVVMRRKGLCSMNKSFCNLYKFWTWMGFPIIKREGMLWRSRLWWDSRWDVTCMVFAVQCKCPPCILKANVEEDTWYSLRQLVLYCTFVLPCLSYLFASNNVGSITTFYFKYVEFVQGYFGT